MEHTCIGCPYATPAERKRHIVAFGGRLDVDLEMNRMTVDGIMYGLTPNWTKLLASLTTRPERLLSMDRLVLAIYGDKDEPEDTEKSIHVYVSNINRRLRESEVPLKIENVLGNGYTLIILPMRASSTPVVTDSVVFLADRGNKARGEKPVKWWLKSTKHAQR